MFISVLSVASSLIFFSDLILWLLGAISNDWSKNGVYADSVCWINTIKESKDKRLDSWDLGEILKNQMRNEHLKRIYRSKIVLYVWLQV